jgi:hypothetical protein
VRIAHLTDLHLRQNLPGTSILGKRRSRDGAALLARALSDARDRGADVAVLTGDLVDVPPYLLTGKVPECMDEDRWLMALEADYRLIKQTLDDSGLPYIAVPGNHDSYEIVDGVFGAEPCVRDIGGLTFVSFWDREGENHVPHRVGHERELFDQMLERPGHPQVHLQHFVVTPELNEDWPHTYQEGDILRRSIVDSGRVLLSLSGHYHPGTALIEDAGTAFSAGSALAESPHCYRIYDVADATDGARSQVTMQVVALLAGQPARRAAFLDLSTCVNALPLSWSELDAVRLQPGVARSLSALAKAGFVLVALMDQRWAAQARSSVHLLDATLDRTAELLADEGALLDAGYFAQDVAEGCPTTVQQASDELRLEVASSRFISTWQRGALLGKQ